MKFKLSILALLVAASLLLMGAQRGEQAILTQTVASGTQTPEQVAATIVSGQGLTWYGWNANCISYSSGCQVPSNGATVSSWYDESGNGNTATAPGSPTFATNQINGNPAVNLGSGNIFNLTTALPDTDNFSVFMVWEPTQTSNTVEIVSSSASGGFAYIQQGTHQRISKVFVADIVVGTYSFTATDWYQTGATYDGTTGKLYVGTSLDNSNAQAETFTVNSGQLFNGPDGALQAQVSLLYVFVGSGVVNSTNVTNMLAALHAKYGT